MQTPLKAVLVGCGGMSPVWLNAARDIPNLEIVGLVDIDEAAARARADQFGLNEARIGTDLRPMLDDTKPDMIFNVTVPEAHLRVTLEALERGCHVLGEKPMTDSIEHARILIDAAQKAGKFFAVLQNRRYDANIRKLRAFLESGAIGPLTTLHSDFFIGAHFPGFREHMQHVLLLDMAIHTFDAARLITGADPVAVYCKEWNPHGSWFDHDASAVAIFEMTGNIVYTYRGSWCAEGLSTTWEADWRVIGERGSVTWNGSDSFKAQAAVRTEGSGISLEDVAVQSIDPEIKVGGHAGVMREFVQCVATGETPETICTDNIKSLAMVFAAIESAETGQRVEVKW